jgi:DNA-directed RNA polymerase
MVHDSYGVHACDVDLLNRILREEFVRIYSEPVLQNFLNEQKQANPDTGYNGCGGTLCVAAAIDTSPVGRG